MNGWLIVQVVGELNGWLFGWFAGLLNGRLILIGWIVSCCEVGWMRDWLVFCLGDWLFH